MYKKIIKNLIFSLLTILFLSSLNLSIFAQDSYQAGYETGRVIGSFLVFIIFILIFIFSLVSTVIWIWMLIDLINTKKPINKTLWAIIVLLVPLGNFVYLFAIKLNKDK